MVYIMEVRMSRSRTCSTRIIAFSTLRHRLSFDVFTDTAASILSNRISYLFDWHWPSITLDTAYSSSLVAVRHAVQTLKNGECKVAVIAGAMRRRILMLVGKAWLRSYSRRYPRHSPMAMKLSAQSVRPV